MAIPSKPATEMSSGTLNPASCTALNKAVSTISRMVTIAVIYGLTLVVGE